MTSYKNKEDDIVLTISSSELDTIYIALSHLCASCLIDDLPRLYLKSHTIRTQLSDLVREIFHYAPYPIQK